MENLTCTHIEKEEKMTLDVFRSNKALVLDFWHTKCVKCPAALEKLNKVSVDYPGVTFASCAVSLSEGDLDMVTEMVEDIWENLEHLYMTIEEKESAKELYGFKAVPFCVVYSVDGELLAKGDPKTIDFKLLFDDNNNNNDNQQEVNDENNLESTSGKTSTTVFEKTIETTTNNETETETPTLVFDEDF